MIVVISIGLGRAYRLAMDGGGEGGDWVSKLSNGGQATKGWEHFYGGS